MLKFEVNRKGTIYLLCRIFNHIVYLYLPKVSRMLESREI